MTLGVKPRRAVPGIGAEFGQLDDLDGAGAVGQPADEAAFFQCGDQPVDAGLGAQVQRILHFVERGRNTSFLQPLVDEAQKLVLFTCQHFEWSLIPVWSGAAPFPVAHKKTGEGQSGAASHSKQIMNEHYLFHMCSATP